MEYVIVINHQFIKKIMSFLNIANNVKYFYMNKIFFVHVVSIDYVQIQGHQGLKLDTKEFKYVFIN